MSDIMSGGKYIQVSEMSWAQNKTEKCAFYSN